ncbi:hypothetical protein Ancab_005927 [Ancistrocladus abbreviatus]
MAGVPITQPPGHLSHSGQQRQMHILSNNGVRPNAYLQTMTRTIAQGLEPPVPNLCHKKASTCHHYEMLTSQKQEESTQSKGSVDFSTVNTILRTRTSNKCGLFKQTRKKAQTNTLPNSRKFKDFWNSENTTKTKDKSCNGCFAIIESIKDAEGFRQLQ